MLEDDPLREKPCTHAGAITQHQECELVAGCDIDPERRRRFGERWDCTRLFASAVELLETVRPDIVCVATHPDTHLSMVQSAAAAGVRVVVCEKPLAHTLGDGRRIARLHRSGKVTVLTNHERRYAEDYRAVKRLVESEELGRLLGVQGTLYFGRTARHDHVLLHDGTHLVDAVNFLTGHVLRTERVVGRVRSASSSAYLHGRAGGVPVVIEVGSERDHLVFEVELSFERGRARVGNGVYRIEKSGPSPYYQGYSSLATQTSGFSEKTGYFINMIADAVACLKEPGRRPVSSAQDGYEVLRFIRAARSMR